MCFFFWTHKTAQVELRTSNTPARLPKSIGSTLAQQKILITESLTYQ